MEAGMIWVALGLLAFAALVHCFLIARDGASGLQLVAGGFALLGLATLLVAAAASA